MSVLKIENLNLDVPGFSLKDINLDIPGETFFALIGPTGSGKSLLLETIMGLMPIKSGRVYLDGKDITFLPPEERDLGIVYQDCALFPHLTVKKNIEYGLKYHGVDESERERRIGFVAKNLDMEHLLPRYPGNLSGGEKQRVALSRVLVLRPKAILLDEPLSSLDPAIREEIRDLLKKLQKKLRITFLIVSHDFSEILYLAESAAIMHGGKIVQQGAVEHIFNKPNSRFVANFVGIKNVFPAKVAPGKAVVNDLELFTGPGNYPAGSNHVSIRPEEITIAGKNSGNCKNRLEGRVVKLTCHGFYYNVLVDVKGVPIEAVWTARDISEYGISPGKEIKIELRPEAVHLFREDS